MQNPHVTHKSNGSIVLVMPAGEFRWRGGGWTATGELTRTDLNMLVNFCKARHDRMTKDQIMQELSNPIVLGALVPNYNAKQKVAPILAVGDQVRYNSKKYWGIGKVVEILNKNVVVVFEYDVKRRWRMNPALLEKL